MPSGVPVGSEPTSVAHGLFVQQVDSQKRFQRSWADIQRYLLSVLDAVGVDPIAAEELTVIPGAEEVLALNARNRRLSSFWLGLVTPIYARVGRKLIDSLSSDTAVRDPKAPGGARFVPELIDNSSGAGSTVLAVDLNQDGAVDLATGTKLGTFIVWGKPGSGANTRSAR